MTPKQKLQHAVIIVAYQWEERELPEINEDNIDSLYEELCENDEEIDAEREIREGEVTTYIECPDSRHYESKSVAAKMPDGTWVGWTYWYGGGKYGEPEAIDWMDDAYDLECVETEKTITVRAFSIKE